MEERMHDYKITFTRQPDGSYHVARWYSFYSRDIVARISKTNNRWLLERAIVSGLTVEWSAVALFYTLRDAKEHATECWR